MEKVGWRAALVVALVTALALMLAYQVRSRVKLDLGDAYDAPFVARFFDGEDDGRQTYRWTREASRIALDAQNTTAPWTLRMRLNGYRPNRPAHLNVEMNGSAVASIDVSDGWQVYSVQGNVAPDAWTGDNTVILRADTFVPKNEIKDSTDTRKLGVTADWIELTPGRSDAALGTEDIWIDFGAVPVVPPWATAATWAAACALLYVTARHIGLPKRPVNVFIGLLIVVIATGFAIGRMWLGYYSLAFSTLSVTLAMFAVLLVRFLPRIAVYLRFALDARALTVLSTILLASIALKWGGAGYPQFHSSDLLFHAHRLEFVAQGNLFFTSELPDAARRVVPYPPALYIALAPLAIFSRDYSALLIVFNALADAAAILAIFFAAQVAVRGTRYATRATLFALFAAFLAAFNPVSFWIYSWGNQTNLFAQSAATILFALLLCLPMTRPRNFLLALFFLLLASVGHLGIFLSLIAFFAFAIVMRFASGDESARREAFALSALLAAGLTLSWIVYYSEFAGVLFTQTRIFVGDLGAGRAAGRGGISWTRAGDVARYTFEQLGGVLLLLGLGGIGLARRDFGTRVRALWGAWMLVGVVFGLITLGAAFSTRYTLWAVPALALSGALALMWLWQRGRKWHCAAYVLCALAFAQTMWLWLDRVWTGYH